MKRKVFKKISVVIPVFNEAKGLLEILRRLEQSLLETKLAYELIFVDDRSTDTTIKFLKRHKKEQITILEKKGIQGKSFSLIEGFSSATGDVVCMIDGDLQYPPEAIPQMLKGLQKTDIVVAKRREYHDSLTRKITSNTFRTVFGKGFFGLDHDIQSGLKMFRREVIDVIQFVPSSPWTFDLEFLHRAREAGYTIGDFDIAFSPRRNGHSKVTFIGTAWEIGVNALKLKAKGVAPLVIAPETGNSMVGAGIRHKKKKYITHSTISHEISALKTFTNVQKIVIGFLCTDFLLGLRVDPFLTLQIVIGFLSSVYFIDVIFNLYLITKSLTVPQEVISSDEEIAALSDSELPIYTILCPLYREAQIVPQFLSGIDKISWPKEKLDVQLLLEEDDKPTIAAIRSMDLPSYVRILVVPHSAPKTKPKACNYGLAHAKGKYLVIFDAEDIPDPLQLKKAYLGFGKVKRDVICLQAKLNYYNPRQNLLTRFFTAEYSLWFDVTLTGLQSINTTIPLGGTSNHFKVKHLLEVEGWDPFNVTEDADLGVRLFRKGYKTAIIDSITLEEANSKWGNWLRQRSRWIKGYMQTYLVHTRGAKRKGQGIHDLIFQLVIGGKIAFVLINPILWIATVAYFTLYAYVGPQIEALYPSFVFYMAAFSLVIGNFLFLYYYMIGIAKKEQWNLMKYIFLIPIYWCGISIAAFIALYQLIFKPHYWEKTVHGLHLVKKTEQVMPWERARKKMQDVLSASEKQWKEFVIKLPRIQIVNDLHVVWDRIRSIYNIIRSVYIDDILSSDEGKETQTKPDTLNILIFNWRDTQHKWAGGAEVYVHELAKRWVKDGHKVTLFCGKSTKKPATAVIEGVRIYRRGGFYTVYIWACIYYFIKFRGKYDVIIDSENGIPFFTPLYTSTRKFLLIHHVHQEVFRKNLKPPFSTLALFLEAKLMPLVYQNTRVITVSPSSKEEILKLKLTESDPIVIYNGVDLKQFKPGIKNRKPLIVYVGRLQRYKSLHVFIDTARKILEKYPKAEFIIAGEGEDKRRLMKYAAKLGLQDKVQFLGFVTQKKKIELYQKAWIFVNPSFMEGWGITTIEAGACGTPTVASDVSGLKDSIRNKETGYLIRYGDVESFSKSIVRLIRNKKLRSTMAKEAQNWAENFSWDVSAEKFTGAIATELTQEKELSALRKLGYTLSKITSLF